MSSSAGQKVSRFSRKLNVHRRLQNSPLLALIMKYIKSVRHPNRVLLTSTLILFFYIVLELVNCLCPSGFPRKTLNVFLLLRYMLHVPPILFFLILSLGQIPVSHPNYEATVIQLFYLTPGGALC
jgi:uncharacterized BrkB/YihY/UPF0761 family membrane protein